MVRWGNCANDERGASLIEFALVMPLLLLILFGIAEVGRFVAVKEAVNTASREASRYGSAIGTSPTAIPPAPRYADCDGIREAAREVAIIVTFADADITINYDDGTTGNIIETCPVGMQANPDNIGFGDRIEVTVTSTFTSNIPFIGRFLETITVTSTDRRSIFEGSL
ncbi:MAG: pilus assembly protein [Acidimicrobiia bacterium]|nr:pilus assembly protein [Acidimicrobiia bacterium]MDH3398124.1 pilus assembly protein [Acidimicrobiia bacterium]MDH5616096.1 pilus assembly protein [Acidimicrobiia bacterium]